MAKTKRKPAAKKKPLKKTVAKKVANKAKPKKKTSPQKSVKKKARKTAAAAPSEITRAVGECFCKEVKDGNWWCVKRTPSGALKRCSGPYEFMEDCEANCV